MITAQLVKELRDATNLGILDCKKALEATNGNIDAAIDWLREKGIAKISHGHDHIVGKPWHIRMVFCVKGDYYSDGGEDCSV